MGRLAGCVLPGVLAVLIATLGIAIAGNGPVTYVYDNANRLVAAYDGAGNVVQYQYDAVGNLLSISRPSSSAVTIFALSPKQGPVGTQVTIYGDGFSATPSQDTVTFQAEAQGVGPPGTVPASVIYASQTTIVVSVPAGSMSGTLTVTAPTGSASTSFTVTAN